MANSSVVSLIEAMRLHELLDPAQLAELTPASVEGVDDAKALAKRLVKRGWLTLYQAQQTLKGNVGKLTVGPFILLEPVGEGGMGQVFKARHRRLGRIVALKLIHQSRLSDKKTIDRFLREMQAAASLSHPNIVYAYDADRVDNTIYFAMEYIEGVDLARVVRDRGRLPVWEACDFIRQAALGLQHAHERKLVHRDIKPSNLLLVSPAGTDSNNTHSRGLVKVLDLGLARLERSAAGETLTQITREGILIGTPDYLSPEQARAPHQVDIRADIYSLGCTLYHLLTGRVPFPGDTLVDKLLMHRREAAEPVEALCPGVPPSLGAVIRRMMAKGPEDRFATPGEVAAALEPFCQETFTIHEASTLEGRAATSGFEKTVALNIASVPSTSTSTVTNSAGAPSLSLPITPPAFKHHSEVPRWRWLTVGAASLALFTVGTVAVVSLKSVPGRDRLDHANAAPAPARAPASSAATVQIHANKPWQDTHIDLEATPPSSGKPIKIKARGKWKGRKDHPGCSADGAPNEPWESSLLGEVPPMCLLARVGNQEVPIRLGQNVSFYPTQTGRLFVQANDLDFGDNSGSLTLEIQGGRHDPGVAPRPSPTQAEVTHGRWTQLASRVESLQGNVDELRKELLEFRSAHAGTPHAVHAGAALMALPSPLDQRKPQPWPLFRRPRGSALDLLAVLGEVAPDYHPARQAIQFSPDGKKLAVSSKGNIIRVWNIEHPDDVLQLAGHEDLISHLDFSPDCRFLLSSGFFEDRTIRLWDLPAGKEIKKLGGEFSKWGFTGIFAANGRTVIYGGFGSLHVHDLNDDGEKKRIEQDLKWLIALAVSPDGRHAISANADSSHVHLWDLVNNQYVRPLAGHSGAVRAVVYLPDGRRALSGGDDHAIRLWDLENGRELKAFEGHRSAVTSLSLSPNGKLLASASSSGDFMLWDVPTGKQLHAWRLPLGIGAIALAPDGRHLATLHTNSSVLLTRIP